MKKQKSLSLKEEITHLKREIEVLAERIRTLELKNLPIGPYPYQPHWPLPENPYNPWQWPYGQFVVRAGVQQ